MTDDWWDQPSQGGDTPVIRHAPDDDQYHLASDPEMVGKMRGSLVGRFAIIPAADKDGASKAFDPSVAGPCHVDPGAPDGGVVFDPTQVRKGEVEDAVSRAHYPHQVFYALGQSARALGIDGRGGFGKTASTGPAALPRTNSKLPNTYIAPQAGGDGRQMMPGLQAPQPTVPYPGQEYNQMAAPNLGALPPLPAPGPAPAGGAGAYPYPAQPQPVPPQAPAYPPPAGAYPPPGYPPPGYGYPPPQPDPNMAAMMNAIVGLQQQMQSLAGARVVPPSPPAPAVGYGDLRGGPHSPVGIASIPAEMAGGRRPPPRRAVEDDDYADETARPIRRVTKRTPPPEAVEAEEPDRLLSRRQTVKEYEEHNRVEPEAVITGFETLDLAWLSGPIPTKPRRKVFFDIPNGGTHSAMFHDVVIAGEGDVVLVYDTRYEEGTQFLPPNLGADVTIALSIQNNKKESITKNVCSMGINFQFGVFDMIVLVKKPGDEVE